MKFPSTDSLFGSKLAHFRALAGLTQRELASKAGVSKAYISHMETGIKVPKFRTVVKLAKALKINHKLLMISEYERNKSN